MNTPSMTRVRRIVAWTLAVTAVFLVLRTAPAFAAQPVEVQVQGTGTSTLPEDTRTLTLAARTTEAATDATGSVSFRHRSPGGLSRFSGTVACLRIDVGGTIHLSGRVGEGVTASGMVLTGKDFAFTIQTQATPQAFSLPSFSDAGTLPPCSEGRPELVSVTQGQIRVGPTRSAADRVYTADQTSNTVSVIDPSTDTLLGQIVLGKPRPNVLSPLQQGEVNVHGLGFSPDGSLLDVISVGSNGVTIIETATNKVRGTIYVGRSPHEGFFTPDGTQLWVTIRGEDYVSVIDPAKMQEIRRIKVANGPGMVVFRPDGKVAFVDSSRTAELDVIDTATYEIIARVPVVSPFSPNLVATPDGEEVWLTHKDVGKVTAVDAHTFQVKAVLDTGKVTNHVNAVSTTAGDFIYVTIGGTNEVKVVRRGAQPEIVQTIKVGATPHGIWPSADNTRVYVALEDGDAVEVIDTTSNRVVAHIPIGQQPQALVYVAGASRGGDPKAGLKTQNLGLPVAKFTLKVPDKPFPFLPEALPKAGGSVVVRALGNVDQVEVKAEGLPANARYVIFLTEKPTAPFGALQYVADFTTGADGKAEVMATGIAFQAFALTGTARDGTPDPAATNASRKQLDHVVIWPADPETTASLFTQRGQPPAVSPFDEDGRAGPAILSDSNDPNAGSPLLAMEFAETGQTVRGRFADYWLQHGGLAVFGYPISPVRYERNADDGMLHLVQYFERNRFELHEDKAAPDDVLLGRLGVTALERQGRDYRSFPTVDAAPAGCRYFPETRHSLCDDFLRFWEANGGLPLFGLPLSEPMTETSPTDGQTYTVQWFERNRFERHPEHAGTPYEVQLGLLGREVYAAALQAGSVEPQAIRTPVVANATGSSPFTVQPHAHSD